MVLYVPPMSSSRLNPGLPSQHHLPCPCCTLPLLLPTHAPAVPPPPHPHRRGVVQKQHQGSIFRVRGAGLQQPPHQRHWQGTPGTRSSRRVAVVVGQRVPLCTGHVAECAQVKVLLLRMCGTDRSYQSAVQAGRRLAGLVQLCCLAGLMQHICGWYAVVSLTYTDCDECGPQGTQVLPCGLALHSRCCCMLWQLPHDAQLIQD